MPEFPDAIYTPRETENLPGIVYDVNDKTNMYSEDFQNLGAEINAIENALGVDLENVLPETGDFSSTISPTGWSASPTIYYAEYVKIGKLVHVSFLVFGTSNSATAQIVLPFVSGLSAAIKQVLRVVDNNGAVLGYCNLPTGSDVLSFGVGLTATNNFTASGNKGVEGSFTYLTD